MEANKETQKKIYLSYSAINTYRECPRQYYYQYVSDEKLKQTIWPGNLIGQVFHSATEEALKLRAENMDDRSIIAELKGKFESMYDKMVDESKPHYKASKEVNSDPDFYSRHDRLMISVVKFMLAYLFMDPDVKLVIPERHVEYAWGFDPDIMLTGYVDITVAMQNNKYKIFDLKVTKDSDTYFFVNWQNAFQKIIYEYLSYCQFGAPPESFGYIVYNRENRTLFVKENGPAEHKELVKLDEVIQKVKAFKLEPNMKLANPSEEKCKWCAYNKVCELKFQSKYVKTIKARKKNGRK